MRGTDTNSRPSAWPLPRIRTTQLNGDRRWYTATFQSIPLPQAAGTEYFSLDVYDVPTAGSRPDRLSAVSGPQARVQRRTVQQIVDFAPLPTLDVPAPQMVEQLVDVLKQFGFQVPEQVIAVGLCAASLTFYVNRRRRNSWWKC